MVEIVHARGRTLSIIALIQLKCLEIKLGYATVIQKLTIYFAIGMNWSNRLFDIKTKLNNQGKPELDSPQDRRKKPCIIIFLMDYSQELPRLRHDLDFVSRIKTSPQFSIGKND